MDSPIEFALWELPETGKIFAVSMTVEDFTALCHEGLDRNKAFFEDLLKTVEEKVDESKEAN